MRTEAQQTREAYLLVIAACIFAVVVFLINLYRPQPGDQAQGSASRGPAQKILSIGVPEKELKEVPCTVDAHGCYPPDAYCVNDPDGLCGEPAQVLQCLCPDFEGLGSWKPPGTECITLSTLSAIQGGDDEERRQ